MKKLALALAPLALVLTSCGSAPSSESAVSDETLFLGLVKSDYNTSILSTPDSDLILMDYSVCSMLYSGEDAGDIVRAFAAEYATDTDMAQAMASVVAGAVTALCPSEYDRAQGSFA